MNTALAKATPADAAAYRRLLDSVFPPRNRVRESQRCLIPDRPGELEVQSRWFAGEFGTHFTSTCGKTVQIVQFGHWNHAGGPDFVDAAVSIDGETQTGAIELDLDVRDWEHHRHAVNPNYDDVILHLYFDSPPGGETVFTRTSCHRSVVQVRLAWEALLDSQAARFAEADAHLGRCAHPLQEMAGEKIGSLLGAAARFRLQRKGERLRRLEAAHGREQALFQGLAETLGYRRNQLATTVLSQQAPLRQLTRQSAPRCEALLFGRAGFLEGNVVDGAPEDTRGYLTGLWDHWWKLRDEYGSDLGRRPRWNFSGCRPNNHPHRRVAALAAVAMHWDEFRGLVENAQQFSEKRLRDFFDTLAHPYWEHHYTLQAARTDKPRALIGRSRVTELLANQIYPMLIPANAGLWEIYQDMPATLDNVKLRRATARLFGEHPHRAEFTRKVFQQQGLLQIYRDFCLEDASGCRECPFPEQLRQWE